MLGSKEKIISKLYKILLGCYAEDETVKVQMVRWAEDLNKSIPFETWEFFWKNTLKTSACTRLQENSIKMMYRWYLTPEKIALMSKSKTSNKCWKCGKEKGSFFHMWWKCKLAKQYWSKIYKEITKIYKMPITKSPEMMLIGLYFETIKSRDRISLWHLLTAARLQYAKLWKQREIPSTKDWIQSVIQMIEMDKLSRKAREQDSEGFKQNWDKVKEYIENRWKVQGFLTVFDWI